MTGAVVFDLWRTLVPLEASHKEAATVGTVRALGVDDHVLRAAWAKTRPRRETVPIRQYLTELQERLGCNWSEEQVSAALRARYRAHLAAFDDERSDAREVLRTLRRDGARLGLVSNCSSDVRAMLEASGLLPYFDDVVLSAEVGLMKPDPRIFRLALDRLGAAGGTYVGDGNDDELAGARRAGMKDVLLDLGEGRHGSYRVTSLSGVLDIVTEAAQ